MLVKNISGQEMTYAWGYTLAANETAEVDNSLIEQVSFQEDLTDHNISILQYLQDSVTSTVEVQISTPLTNPSVDQKGAMVGASSPSVRNPFATREDIDIDDSVFEFENNYDITCTATKILVEGVILETVSETIHTNSTFCVDAQGNVTASLVTPETIFYILINSSGELRPSMVSSVIGFKLLAKAKTDENRVVLDIESYNNPSTRAYFEEDEEVDSLTCCFLKDNLVASIQMEVNGDGDVLVNDEAILTFDVDEYTTVTYLGSFATDTLVITVSEGCTMQNIRVLLI